jgi:multisubunit Na+/H+ antiporter MnhG subunit
MAYHSSNIGVIAIILGTIIFVVATGDIIFRVLGVILAIALINHGLQLMGKPSLFSLIQDWFDQMRR